MITDEHKKLIEQAIKLQICFNTDDYFYGTSWKTEIPKEFITGNDEQDINYYYKLMGDLEDFFVHLFRFHTEIKLPGNFPCQELCIKYNDSFIVFGYVSGQGGDFYLRTNIDQNDIKFYLTFEQALELSKLSEFEQAKWYLNDLQLKVQKPDIIKDNYQKAIFKLGQSIFMPYQERINNSNYEQILFGD